MVATAANGPVDSGQAADDHYRNFPGNCASWKSVGEILDPIHRHFQVKGDEVRLLLLHCFHGFFGACCPHGRVAVFLEDRDQIFNDVRIIVHRQYGFWCIGRRSLLTAVKEDFIGDFSAFLRRRFCGYFL